MWHAVINHVSVLFADLSVGFEQLSQSVAEGAGSVTVCAVITELPEGGYEGTVVASITSQDTDSAGLYTKQ